MGANVRSGTPWVMTLALGLVLVGCAPRSDVQAEREPASAAPSALTGGGGGVGSDATPSHCAMRMIATSGFHALAVDSAGRIWS